MPWFWLSQKQFVAFIQCCRLNPVLPMKKKSVEWLESKWAEELHNYMRAAQWQLIRTSCHLDVEVIQIKMWTDYYD